MQPEPAASTGRSQSHDVHGAALEIVRNLFLQQRLADMNNGKDLAHSVYEAGFPGFEAIVRAEFERSLTADPLTRQDSGTSGRKQLRNEILPTGTLVGRYRVEGVLGEGGMGVAYLSSDPGLERTVVLKAVRPDRVSAEAKERLRCEARLAAKLDHPNICRVLDVVEDEKLGLFIVFAFVPGHTLAAGNLSTFIVLTPSTAGEVAQPPDDPTPGVVTGPSAAPGRQTLTQEKIGFVLALIETIARGIHFAHEAGVIHRDLKPGNIMLGQDGSPVILDFGLACDQRFIGSHDDPSTGGTPPYMAPEQIEDLWPLIGPRTDVHALGVMLYELLSGRRPFHARSREELFEKIVRGECAQIRRLVPEVSKDLEAVVHKAMESDPAGRFGSARDFADELARIQRGEETLTRPLSLGAGLFRRARRHPALIAAAAALLLLAVVAAGLWWKRKDLGATVGLSQFYVLYQDAMAAVRAEKRSGFTAAEKERLLSLADGHADALILIEAPGDRTTERKLSERILEAPRAGQDAPSTLGWLPRGAVTTDRPTFVFKRPLDPKTALKLRILHSENGREVKRQEFEVALPSDVPPDGFDTFTLPPGLTLERGSYEWSLVSPIMEDKDAPVRWKTESSALAFRVSDSAELASLTSSVSAIKEVPLRSFLHATALLQADYFIEARAILKGVDVSSDPHLEARVHLLRAAIAGTLGGPKEFRRALSREAPDDATPAPPAPQNKEPNR